MHIDEVLRKIEKMNSVVEKLDYVYRVFSLIEEKEKAEKLINELKAQLSSERATFVPRVKLSEPKFEIGKGSLEDKMVSSEEKKTVENLAFKLDVGVKLWKDGEFSVISNQNYKSLDKYEANYKPPERIEGFKFKKYKLD